MLYNLVQMYLDNIKVPFFHYTLLIFIYTIMHRSALLYKCVLNLIYFIVIHLQKLLFFYTMDHIVIDTFLSACPMFRLT